MSDITHSPNVPNGEGKSYPCTFILMSTTPWKRIGGVEV
jgi:hypothetical protein